MANILTSPGVAAKRYWHSATRTAPWSGFVALTILLLSLLSACIIDTSYQDDLQAATGLFISALCILSMAFIPPKRCTSPTILGNLLPGPHLILFFVLCLWVFMYAPRNPPEHTLSLDAVTLAFATFIYQLFFATHGFPLSTRLGAFAMAMTVHTIHPLHSIGWREPFLIFVGSMTGILCGAAIVNDARVTRRMVKIANANRRADSRLNHVIKGQCGGAAALLAGIIETRQEQGEHVKVSDAELLESLVQIHRMLEQATEWCHKREVFLQLEDGSYTTTSTEVCLRKELEGMLGPRAEVIANDVVSVDRTVMRLLVQEVADNAIKYSPPGSAFQAKATLKDGEIGPSVHLAISNVNRPEIAHLSAAECELIFRRGYRRQSSRRSLSDLRSNGLGLSSVKLAAEAIGGTVTMAADKLRTTVHIILPAVRLDDEVQAAEGHHVERTQLQSAPEYDVDGLADAPDARPEYTMRPAEFPAMPAAIPSSSPIGHTGALKATTSASRCALVPKIMSNEHSLSPVCIGLDDSPMLRKAQMTLFHVFLKADADRSSSIGASIEEANAFVDIAMGKRTISLEPADLPPADIVVLDQHLDYDDSTYCKKGTQLAQELRFKGFTGVICILTGSSQEDMVQISLVPSVDFAFGKCMSPQDIASKLLAAHKSRKALPFPSS